MLLMIAIFLTLGLSISLQSLFAAWTAPGSIPPTNNVLDFLVGGSLGVGNNIAAVGKIQGTELCIGTDCKNAWPTSGSGVSAHNLLTGLDGDDHLQYLKTDGTRPVTGRQTFNTGLTVASGQTLCLGGICNSTWPDGGVADGTGPWVVNGSNIYYNSGNVGIGTNDPLKKLQIIDGIVKMSFGTSIANIVALDGVSPLTVDGFSIVSNSSNNASGINTRNTAVNGCSGYTMLSNLGGTAGYVYTCNDVNDINIGAPLGGVNIISSVRGITMNSESSMHLTSFTGSINFASNQRMHIQGQQELYLLNEGGVYVSAAFGGVNAGNLYVDKNVTAQGYFYSSDRNLKKNIEPISSALDKINQINGVNFEWKDSGKKDVGVIAQDVEKVFPDLVGVNPSTGYKTVEYGNLVAPLIEAVKEQQKMIKDLQKEVRELKEIK